MQVKKKKQLENITAKFGRFKLRGLEIVPLIARCKYSDYLRL